VKLRVRFGLWAAVFTAAVVLVFGAAVDVGYRRQLLGQLETLLLEDLSRVAVLLEEPMLGASFASSAEVGVTLQFVDAQGRVALAWGDEELLPAPAEPMLLEGGERSLLVAQVPWPATGGTIRMAHDVTAAVRSMLDLGRLLRVAGAVVIVVAALSAWALARRALRPLAELAEQTRRVDPSTPGRVDYRGPRDEVHDLADGLNQALGAIRRRQEDERAFLLEVAHEIAAPLTLVHYHLDGLRHRDAEDPSLRAASDAARELLRTSQDLLMVARGDLSRRLEASLVDLREIVGRVADEYPQLRVTAGEEAQVVGDAERLVQVVRNLVRNAVQASGGAEGVEVELGRDGDDHLIRVRDRGPGMSAEATERAFERGYSGGRGSGVGLAVARSLTELHGGSVRVAETSSAGTVMEVRLPDVTQRMDVADATGAGRHDPVSEVD
jgi:two-component system, OmpR family, sensor kinase